MNSCKYCHSLVVYSLIDRIFFYHTKRYFMYNMCYECSLIFSDMFYLKIEADKKRAQEEDKIYLQKF